MTAATSTREQAYGALFTLLQGISGIKTCTRRLNHWADLPPESQPAIYLQVGNENRTQQRGLPPHITLEASVWVYVNTEGEPAGPVINAVLQGIDAVLQPMEQVTNPNTLGGLVRNCWIEGVTSIYEGDLGDQAVAVIPVKMLIT